MWSIQLVSMETHRQVETGTSMLASVHLAAVRIIRGVAVQFLPPVGIGVSNPSVWNRFRNDDTPLRTPHGRGPLQRQDCIHSGLLLVDNSFLWLWLLQLLFPFQKVTPRNRRLP